jgi:TPR repeat protein
MPHRLRLKVVLGGCLVALSLFGYATAGTYEDAQSALLKGDYPAALRLLRPLAAHGNREAQFTLGVMYDSAGMGVPSDCLKAVSWFRKAADQGQAAAEYALVRKYLSGDECLLKDIAEGVRLDRKAAQQGYVPAQFTLGAMYFHGVDVPQDNLQAYFWFTLAIANDHPSKNDPRQLVKLREWRNQVAEKLTPAQISQAERLAREWIPKTN